MLFKRGASEAAEGCLASIAAKLVKTAIEIPSYIHACENKSGRQIWDNFGTFWYENFFWYIHACGNKSGRQFWHVLVLSLISYNFL